MTAAVRSAQPPLGLITPPANPPTPDAESGDHGPRAPGDADCPVGRPR